MRFELRGESHGGFILIDWFEDTTAYLTLEELEELVAAMEELGIIKRLP